MANPAAVGIDPDSPFFDTADQAAQALTPKLTNGGKEHAGVLVQHANGKYQYSTLMEGDQDSFKLAARLPQGSKLAGIVHSHPGDEDVSQVFSPGDVSMAKQLNVPSYVLFQKTNSTRKFVPGSTQTRDMQMAGSRQTQKVADGDPLQQPPQQQVASDTSAPATPPTASSQTLQIPIQGSELTSGSAVDPTQTAVAGNGLNLSNLLGGLLSAGGAGLSAYNSQSAYSGLQNALNTIGPTQLNGYTVGGPGGSSSGYNQNGTGSIDLGSLNPAYGNLAGAAGGSSAAYNPALLQGLTNNATGTLGASTNALNSAYGNYNSGMNAANTQLGALNQTYGQVYNNTMGSLQAQQQPQVQQAAFGLQNTLFGNGTLNSSGATSGALAAGNFGSQVNAMNAQDSLSAQTQALNAQTAGAQNYSTLSNSANGILSNAMTNFGNTNSLISGLNTASLNNSLSAVQGAGALNTQGLNNYNAALGTGTAQATATNQSLFPYASVATALAGQPNGLSSLASLLSGAGSSVGSSGISGLLSSLLGKGASSGANSLLGSLGSSGITSGTLGAAQDAGLSSIGDTVGGTEASDLAGITSGTESDLGSLFGSGFSAAGGAAADTTGLASVGTGAIDAAADAGATADLGLSGASAGASSAGGAGIGLGAAAGAAAAAAPFAAILGKMFLDPDDVMLKAPYWQGMTQALQGNSSNINTGPGGGGSAAKQYSISDAVQEALNTPQSQVPQAIQQQVWATGLVPVGTWGFSNTDIGSGTGGISNVGAHRSSWE